jgi:dTDP-4-dehydrorhamnose 3,5-epimerase
MKIETLCLPGCLQISPKIVRDARGEFVKPFIETEYRDAGLCIQFAEEYYSRSVRNVLRGMHFQTPPYQFYKLVSCIYGCIRDVIVDLRRGSPCFGVCEVIDLESTEGKVLYLPPGIAHGFLVTSDTAIVSYKVTAAYAPENDTGVRWDSIGVDWGLKDPIVSTRDASFQKLREFETPFTYDSREIGL